MDFLIICCSSLDFEQHRNIAVNENCSLNERVGELGEQLREKPHSVRGGEVRCSSMQTSRFGTRLGFTIVFLKVEVAVLVMNDVPVTLLQHDLHKETLTLLVIDLFKVDFCLQRSK